MRARIRLLALACAALPLPAFAIGTAFTYQGSLEVSGAAANGQYDLQFQLLDGASAAVGGPLVADNVVVTNGVFTVQLDFGGTAFNGDDRRLRIAVRPGASSGAFTTLNPPTNLTATPYAQVASVAEIASSVAANSVNGASVVNGSLGSADVSPAQIQLRVAGTCPAGSSIRAIDPAGAVTCQTDAGGSSGTFTIPFINSYNAAGTLFSLTNEGDGTALEGVNNTTTSSIAAVRGIVTSTAPGGFSSAVRGINNGTGGLGIGVWGSQAGSGWGVYGVTPSGLGVYGNSSAGGYGVYGNSNTGTGLYGTSTNGIAATVANNNNSNNNTVLNATNVGNGTVINVSTTGNGAGVVASTGSGFAIHGITSEQTSAGVIADNTGAGEAVVGRTTSDIAGAVVGRNDGGGYGVRGFVSTDTSGTGVGVYGQIGLNGGTGYAGKFENFNEDNTDGNTLYVESNSNGNIPDNTLGNVASFVNTNTNSVSAAVRGEVTTIFGNFGAAGVFGVSKGTGGFAGLFHASNPNGNGASLVSITDGNGNAITANAGKNGNGVETSVDGTGNAIYAWVPSFGTGRAARFETFNEDNTNPVVSVKTIGNGTGINAIVDRNTGTSPALMGEVNSIFANFGTAGVYGRSSGTGGYAGLFYASNASGNGPALMALTEGNGNAVTANAGGTGDGIEATVDGAGTAVFGWIPNFGSGRAARFINFNTSNTNPALTVEQRAVNGAIAVFRHASSATNVARINTAGRGFFNGGTVASGADLAEVVPLTGATPEPGDVVEIDPDAPSHFRLSTSARSALVAGVISTEPGMILNHAGADEGGDDIAPSLALAGRVPVKVTDENGAVAPGDLLVASSTPGHAMRASPEPAAGTVVGKALEAFDDTSADLDSGVIEMLVMLR